jgi:uncharacterized protein
MNTHLLALQLMAAQGCLGAFDTLYHHELTEALPSRSTARLELSIHCTRALIYSVLFVGLSAWAWHGVWALVLIGIFLIEIILTLWDFVVEDRTRLLPATERVTHTVLAINGGAFIVLLMINFPVWLAEPTALAWQPMGPLSVFLALCGVGVAISGIRDGFAARRIRMRAGKAEDGPAIHFGNKQLSVLVTGATGFIGQHLVAALLADGHLVTVLTRHVRQAAWLFNGGVRCIAGMDDLPSSHRIDMVVNLAGARILGWRWTEARRALLRRSRVGLTQDVVAWIAKAQHKPQQLLSASAIGFYGVQAQGDETELTENSGAQAIFMSQLCREWEDAAQAATAYGVRVACMRFGLVFGAQGSLPLMMLPIKLGLGGPLGGGSQWMSWIHVRDVVSGIAHLSRMQQVDGVYNFTAPDSVTQARFSRIAAAQAGRPSFFPTPGLPIRLLLGEQADLLLEGQRVVPARLLASGFTFNYPDVKSALKSLA